MRWQGCFGGAAGSKRSSFSALMVRRDTQRSVSTLPPSRSALRRTSRDARCARSAAKTNEQRFCCGRYGVAASSLEGKSSELGQKASGSPQKGDRRGVLFGVGAEKLPPNA